MLTIWFSVAYSQRKSVSKLIISMSDNHPANSDNIISNNLEIGLKLGATTQHFKTKYTIKPKI